MFAEITLVERKPAANMRVVFFVICLFWITVFSSHAQEPETFQLKGLWWSVQHGNYYETIFADTIVWWYSDVSGALPYTYELRNKVILRKTSSFGLPVAPLTIEFIAADSMKLRVGDRSVTYYRTDVGPDKQTIDKLLKNDPEAIAQYEEAYRARARKRR